MNRFFVIGITDQPRPFFPPEVLEVIKEGKVFSGGRRHHEMVAQLLPAGARCIDLTVPLDAVFEQYKEVFSTPNPQTPTLRSVVVFASGDPLFFGFANTIQRVMPEADIVLYPTFNSLQLLAHRLVVPYHDMRVVSLTGRPWPAFDQALMERSPKIGILTDREHTPAAIARRMLSYGYGHYDVHVGEHLGNPDRERVVSCTLEEAAETVFDQPNCVLLVANTPLTPRRFGIPDAAFALLGGREKMITKMPIRLLTLQALDLPRRHVLWDIGFCTGSVSIEARQLFPQLHVVAFEVRPECEAIIAENARRHGVPGIEVVMGDFLTVGCDRVATNHGADRAPDAVFIGGHGGQLKAIMAKVLENLSPDGIIVMNSVTSAKVPQNSRQLWDEACQELNLQQEPPLRLQLNDYNPIEILKCRRK